MTTQLAVREQGDAAIMEQVVVQGDLSGMRPEQRVNYYRMVCQSLGLNELTKPFDYLKLNGKLVLYARKDATEQLRKINRVSITRLETDTSEGVFIVTAYAQSGDGRTDSDVGAVNIQGLAGENKANAMMKAITKAKRRVTLSICGLGFLDETEVSSIPDAQAVTVNMDTGEIVEGHVVETRQSPTLKVYATAQEAVEDANRRIGEQTGDVLPFYGNLADAGAVLRSAGFTGWPLKDAERMRQAVEALVQNGVSESEKTTGERAA